MLLNLRKNSFYSRIRVFIHMFRFMRCFIRVQDPSHAVTVAGPHAIVMAVIASEASDALPSAGAASLTLVVPCEGIAPGKAAVAFRTNMGSFPCVQFSVAFEVMETPETRVAPIATERLFLTVGQ